MKTYIHPVNGKTITKNEYFNFMFGKEFMKSNDKGRIKEYEIKNK